MYITYNAPFVLNFTFLAIAFRLLSDWLPSLIHWMAAPASFNLRLSQYPSFVLYILAHSDWIHLTGNLSLLLILGPMLEEKYGSWKLLLMSIVTALATSLLNAWLFTTSIVGASGIIFMMIVLSSFGSVSKKKKIPLTFLLVLVFYLGNEILEAFSEDNISQFAHILGGASGAIFGFVLPTQGGNKKEVEQADSQVSL